MNYYHVVLDQEHEHEHIYILSLIDTLYTSVLMYADVSKSRQTFEPGWLLRSDSVSMTMRKTGR